MANGSTFLDEISAMVAEHKKELREVQAQAEEITARAAAIERSIRALQETARIFRAKHSINEPIDPKELKGMTQTNALIRIARKGNGLLRANEAKRILLQAEMISNPKNAAAIVYTLIKRSDRFEWVKPGVYKLVGGRPARPADIREIRTA